MLTRAAPSREPAAPISERQGESIIQLLRRLTDELLTLLRQEIALATAEVTRTLTRLFKGVASIAAGGAVLFAGILVLLAAAVLGLALTMPAWLAALIVGGVVSVIGAALMYLGKKTMEPIGLDARRSMESLRQDKDVLMRKQA